MQYGDIDLVGSGEFFYDLLPFTAIAFLIGQILVIVGFATSRFAGAGEVRTSFAPPEPRYTPPADSGEDRPGDPDFLRPTAGDQSEPGFAGPPAGQGAYDQVPYPPPQYGYSHSPYAASTMGPPARLYRPGWGLAGTWIALSALAFIFGMVALALVLDAGGHISDDELAGILAAYGLWFFTGIPAIVISFVWLYQAWRSVPPEYRSTSPGKAVGFMFIPFFNLYWVFRAIPGLSASIRRAQIALDPRRAGGAGFGLGIAACVIAVIPYINFLSWFFFLVWVIVANGDRNRLLMTRIELEGRAPAPPAA